MRYCPGCDDYHALEAFPKSSYKDGLKRNCKQYYNARRRELYRTNPRYAEQQRIYRRQYKQTENGKNAIKKSQQNRQQRRKEDPEYKRIERLKLRVKKLKSRYNISLEIYENLMILQEHKCAICKKPFIENESDLNGFAIQLESPRIDHNHNCCGNGSSCGQCVRGLLCGRCNIGIAHFNDDILILQNAINYIQYPPMKFIDGVGVIQNSGE